MRTQLAGADLDDSMREDAGKVVASVEEAFRSAPSVLERARRLVRYAARLTETDLCQGRERKVAAEAVQHAIQAYGEAREAAARGKTASVRNKFRSTVEWAALAAAKTARGCASGQTTIAPRKAHTPVEPAAPEPTSKGKGKLEPVAATSEPRRSSRRRMGTRPVAEADAEKDKLLLNAFQDAVASAISDP
ncbi:MAG: hypothetical protein ABMA64_28775 [Myxococcota bacterium]